MTSHASDFLADLFGSTPSTAVAAPVFDRAEPAMALTADLATSGKAPSPSGEPQAVDLGPLRFDPADWIRQPDVAGRWGWQRKDFDAGDWLDFESLPDPAPCPRCGSLEVWEPMAADPCGIEPGGWRCLHCDPPTKSRALAARAAKLRERAATYGNRAPDTPQSATEATSPTQETSGAAGPCATVYGAMTEC